MHTYVRAHCCSMSELTAQNNLAKHKYESNVNVKATQMQCNHIQNTKSKTQKQKHKCQECNKKDNTKLKCKKKNTKREHKT